MDIEYFTLHTYSRAYYVLCYIGTCYLIVSDGHSCVNYTKDFPKERYNTYAKSCNSNLYTKYPSATYSGLLLGTMRCL